MKTTLLLALSDRRVRSALAAALRAIREPELSVYILSDPFALVDTLKDLRPDIVIASCNVCSPVLADTVREVAGLSKCLFVPYCDTASDLVLAERSDAHLTGEESDKELADLLDALIHAETKEEEEESAEELTPRERDVIIGVVKGKTNKEIADELFISPNTVTTHRRNIVKKLDIHSASGLTVYAIMNKLVSLDEIEI